jgi:hypothetical protein
MLEAVRAGETSGYFNETTRLYILEGCNLPRCRENLISHTINLYGEVNSSS